MNEKYGYQGTNVSGKTTRRAPFSAASPIAASTFATVPPAVSRSGAICTAATRMGGSLAMLLSSVACSDRPGVQLESVVAPVQQDQIQHVERVDRSDAGDQRWLAVAIERLQCEAAGI